MIVKGLINVCYMTAKRLLMIAVRFFKQVLNDVKRFLNDC